MRVRDPRVEQKVKSVRDAGVSFSAMETLESIYSGNSIGIDPITQGRILMGRLKFQSNSRIDAEKTMQRIQALQSMGYKYSTISKVSGVSPSTIQGISTGRYKKTHLRVANAVTNAYNRMYTIQPVETRSSRIVKTKARNRGNIRPGNIK